MTKEVNIENHEIPIGRPPYQRLRGRVGLGETSGTYGWGGAAGTAAFADFKRGLRATMMTQYMSLTPYPLTDEFIGVVRGRTAQSSRTQQERARVVKPVKAEPKGRAGRGRPRRR